MIRHLVTGNTIELVDLSRILARAKAQARVLEDQHTKVIDQLSTCLAFEKRGALDLLESLDGREEG